MYVFQFPNCCHCAVQIDLVFPHVWFPFCLQPDVWMFPTPQVPPELVAAEIASIIHQKDNLFPATQPVKIHAFVLKMHLVVRRVPGLRHLLRAAFYKYCPMSIPVAADTQTMNEEAEKNWIRIMLASATYPLELGEDRGPFFVARVDDKLTEEDRLFTLRDFWEWLRHVHDRYDEFCLDERHIGLLNFVLKQLKGMLDMLKKESHSIVRIRRDFERLLTSFSVKCRDDSSSCRVLKKSIEDILQSI